MFSGGLQRLSEIDGEDYYDDDDYDDDMSGGSASSPHSLDSKGLDHSFVSTGSNSGIASSSGPGLSGSSAIDVSDITGSSGGKHVFRLKMTVFVVLGIAAVTVAVAIYLSTSRSEEGIFEDSFEQYTNQVLQSFTFNVERKFAAIEAFSVAITSLAIDVGVEESWPNYIVPDFDIRASNTRELADAASLTLSPIVTKSQRPSWEDYAVNNTQWIQDSLDYEAAIAAKTTTTNSRRRRMATAAANSRNTRHLQQSPEIVNGISKDIFYYDFFGVSIESFVDESDGPYTPIWQHFPTIPEVVNLNSAVVPFLARSVNAALDTASAVIGAAWEPASLGSLDVLVPWETDSRLTRGEPTSTLLYPVFDTLDEDHEQVALLTLYVDWRTYFDHLLPAQAQGVIVVLENECDQIYTFRIDGLTAKYLGEGDLHDTKYDRMGRTFAFNDIINLNSTDHDGDQIADVPLNKDFCPHSLSVYPSQDIEDDFVTNEPLIYTIASIVVFLITGAVFFVYNFIIERRMKIVTKRVIQSRAIVSSLFPAAVRDRLFRSDDSQSTSSNPKPKKRGELAKMRIKNFLHDPRGGDRINGHPGDHRHNEMRPIADLFPHTTVMFADIAGFTSWSSERDPAHVFTLLQTLYHAFDTLAKKRAVFKVETIGDCYVAVTGLPDPQPDHAVRMSKFASECKKKMHDLVHALKDALGEDTLDLAMRFGLHSGPVTAGVLRGEKSRFQLFGTTVSKAEKMEHTGMKNKIQVTQETADLLVEAGKGHWLFQRIDDAGSRGGIQTYWVEPQSHTQELKTRNAVPTRVVQNPGAPPDKAHNSDRLIDWNVDLLKRALKNVVAARKDGKIKPDPDAEYAIGNDASFTVRDEMKEFVSMPKYNPADAKTDPATVLLGEDVEKQLRDYVKLVSTMYHDKPFHNFKHASNVCTNASKLLGSIVSENISKRSSDPLARFACLFAALIHDLDHQGLTNMLLIKERPHMAALYRNKSVAEQNSVDLAWNLLMDPDFEALQRAIFCNDDEFKRFRGVVVNVVMATDIFDKELSTDRNERWAKAFDYEISEDDEDGEQLRATVLIEHVIQVADIMHTMQHFYVYQSWNARLFEEMYLAYSTGKSTNDPSVSWYQGEIWFFDNCVIPLAQRIKDSGVFGVQGSDCLKYAISNKKEWAQRGGEILKEIQANVLSKIQYSSSMDNKNAPLGGTLAKAATKESTAETEKKDPDKHLIEWNVDLFKRMLRQLLAHRMASDIQKTASLRKLANSLKEGSPAREEVDHRIKFPSFDKSASKLKVDPEEIELSQEVQDQLRDYISFIAAMYRDNEFHNFKHASSVTTASSRYLQRVVDDNLEAKLNHPLAQFSVAFAALIHDVDHPGVPNAQLVKEEARIAVLHNNKSVAEQNSVDLAWSVLMDEDYKDLQGAIYGSQEEFTLFRKILVNSVIATDLFDEDLIKDRAERWEAAFDDDKRDPSLSDEDYQDLRATIVVEFVMQAADIGHCMQHFHSFKRWNERLFLEAYDAFDSGRTEEDPSQTWHTAELKFFDNFVLPLARRMQSCGVFGAAGEDAIRLAQLNRKDWVLKGIGIVEDFKKKYIEQKEADRSKRN